MDAFSAKPDVRIEVKEGEEKDDFWDAVGGKDEYSRQKDSGVAAGFEPRLFEVSNAHGYMWMKEVVAFAQEDLNNYDCFILDAYDTIYLWIGHLSNKFERKGVYTKAEKYLANVTDSRKKDEVAIVEVEAGCEPPSFTVQFI